MMLLSNAVVIPDVAVTMHPEGSSVVICMDMLGQNIRPHTEVYCIPSERLSSSRGVNK